MSILTRWSISGIIAAMSTHSDLIYVGIDIGGTKTLVVASHDGRTIDAQAKVETPADSGEGMREIERLVNEVSAGKRIAAIGIAAPGPLDLVHGRILKTPNMTWDETAICDQLKARYDVPVILENDANAAALAEATIGAAQHQPYVLYVTVSTGVGTGMVINGKIYHGASDVEGGHMLIPAHDRTLPGSKDGAELEAEISGRALKRRFHKLGFQIPAESKNWDVFAHDLAIGLHNLIVVMAPSVVVLGGGVSVHYDKFVKHLHRHLDGYKHWYPVPPIVQADLVEEAPIHGALILASRLG